MAIATLLQLYANPLVFQGVVKISKLVAVRVVVETGTMDGIKNWFTTSVRQMRVKLNKWRADESLYRSDLSDAVSRRTAHLLSQIEESCS